MPITRRDAMACLLVGSAIPSPLAAQANRGLTITFFDTSAHLDEMTRRWHLPLHGWIYEAEASRARKAAIAAILRRAYGLEMTPQAQPFFDERVNLLLSDNKGGRRVGVALAGRQFEMPPSAPNGHFSGTIEFVADRVEAAASGAVLPYRAALGLGDRRSFAGEIHLVRPQGLSVISDIDDTVKITEVTDRKRMLENTFYKPFAAVPGMASFYQQLAKGGASFHFVSSSPWHLYVPLKTFLAGAGFPPASLSLKVIRLKDSSILDLFKPGLETKPPQIEAILQRYPQRAFVLIGDSGEQDPEVYAGILRKYGERVRRILIRNVTGAKADDARFAKVFAGIDRLRWQLFEKPEEIQQVL